MRVGSLRDKEALMGRKKKSEHQIAEALTAFAKSYLPITPNLVSVCIHPHCVIATLRGIVTPAEKKSLDRGGLL
jgi:uncharacterized protein YbcI